jgi:hypothetical protein
MNLKKSDKIIAILGVVILIVAAIGVVLLMDDDNGGDDDKKGDETKGITVNWEIKKGDSFEVPNTVGKEGLTDSFTVDVPSNAVLTSVDVNITWTDNKGLLGFKLPVIGQILGKDTLTVQMTGPTGKTGDYSGKGGVVDNASVETFSICSPADDVYDLKDEGEVMAILEELYDFGSQSFEYEATINAKGLFDKGNDFTFIVEYNYAEYTIGDDMDKTTDDDTDDENPDETLSTAEVYNRMGLGFGTFY